MIALMRLILASAALLVIYLDPAEPDRFVSATYGALILYVVYSLTIFVATSGRRRIESLSRWAHWIDVLWFTVLIGLSSGTNSIFFFFYYFAILTASFRRGFATGVRVTLVSSLLFTIVGYLTGLPDVEINRLILRPVTMLGLGYMVAYWGGCEIELRNRLSFLKDITHLSNPRFGVDHIISSAMERFREYYDADKCLLITNSDWQGDYRLRIVGRKTEGLNAPGEVVGPEIAELFLSPAAAELIIQQSTSSSFRYDLETGERTKPSPVNSSLINTLESDRFLSVPINYRGEWIGRFYVVGPQRKLKPADADFVLQGIAQMMPLLENILLVDRLASDAAAHERDKIARDLHDSVLQPYIGLQMGLASLQQKIERRDDDVLQHVNELRDLTVRGVTDLRAYAGGIKSGDSGNNPLLSPAIRRFAARFAEATGIKVNVQAPDDLRTNDRLTAEIFQLITEGLSNIRRHTSARTAWAVLSQDDQNLTLRIENEDLEETNNGTFRPRSLTERAASLGGRLEVHRQAAGRTIVEIQIPL